MVDVNSYVPGETQAWSRTRTIFYLAQPVTNVTAILAPSMSLLLCVLLSNKMQRRLFGLLKGAFMVRIRENDS